MVIGRQEAVETAQGEGAVEGRAAGDVEPVVLGDGRESAHLDGELSGGGLGVVAGDSETARRDAGTDLAGVDQIGVDGAGTAEGAALDIHCGVRSQGAAGKGGAATALGVVPAGAEQGAGIHGHAAGVAEGAARGEIATVLDGKTAVSAVGGEVRQAIGIRLVDDLGTGSVQDNRGLVAGNRGVGEFEGAGDIVGAAGHSAGSEVGK